MSPLDRIRSLGEWLLSDVERLLFSVFAIVAGYLVYRLLIREISRLKERDRLEEHVAYTLTRLVQWVVTVGVLSAILLEFGVTLGMVSGLLTLLGGTIVGFAAINTLGNALAGLIVMTSRPFKVGDRIFFNGQFADVQSIELIYTKMVTLDKVLVSVPNQELLKDEIDNYGKDNVVRRHVSVTPGFDIDAARVERALLQAADQVPGVVREPQPYVWITDFQSYAVEYTLYVFIKDIKRLRAIEAALHRSVLETCKEHGIDISTPLLLRQIQD
jgi:potassium efflux system protein